MENDEVFFMVLADDSDRTTVRHKSRDRAVAEARRLAQANKGKRFFVLCAIGVALVHDPVEWRNFDLDAAVPF